MSNKSKAKGTRAESAIVRYLNEHGIKAERRALHGSADIGDILVGDDLIIEVKAGQQTAAPSRTQMIEWLNQTIVEGENCGLPSVLCVVRYRRKLEDAEIWIPEGGELKFMYLDRWVNKIG